MRRNVRGRKSRVTAYGCAARAVEQGLAAVYGDFANGALRAFGEVQASLVFERYGDVIPWQFHVKTF